MANRLKEDEKNERIIRGLLKLQDNRRCINCNSLGTQYVCTNFWTFVCTNCSGIHREFTHRVKSVSMAKFTSQEVKALQEGGNQRAKEVLLKEWDPQRQSFPDSSNVERLRNFIKHVYVDRRYTGERNYDKPPRVKMGDKEDSYDIRRDTYQGGSRSPPYEDTYERRYNEQSSPGGRSDDKNSRYGYDERSPGNEQENRQFGDYRRTSPTRPEVINDWRRDDRFGNGRKFEDRRISDGDSKLEGRSPEQPKDPESSSPPVVRPVREILGDNVLPLRISEPPKANGVRVADGSTNTQRTASSGNLGSANENQAEVKLETTGSLIDFDADPKPSPAVAQAQQKTVAQSVVQPASSANDNNWASFDLAPQVKVSQTSSNLNTLETVFSQLSVPASVPGQVSGIPIGAGAPVIAPATNVNVLPGGGSPVASVGHTPFSVFSAAAPAAPAVSGFATFPSANAPAPAPGVTPLLPVSVNAGNSFSMQHQPPLFPTAGGQFIASQFTPPVAGSSNNQQWNTSLAQNAQGPPAAQPAQSVPKPALESASGGLSQPSPVEVKSTGRTALPEDLFTANYSSFPASVPGWQTVPPHGMVYAMQYNTAAPMPNFVHSKSTTNPFDVNNDSHPVQAQTFPSMASLQGALQNVSHPPGLLRTSSLTPSPAWMPPQASPYPSAMPSQMPTYAAAIPSQMPTHAPAMPPRPYLGPQVPSNVPPSGHQGMGGLGSEGASFGFMNPDPQLAGRLSASATPQAFTSVGGNPFG
ncbi:Arf-GAP domain-containing protein [Citrus sinensis]|uniref:Arf-GAP domain-containing protein n=2 Tax=Citrus TaxID=2706 RepID=A0A2H5QPV5_CITUN|nr:probable ADP-ribosylation factor GTPase-activating protein AGD14 isoform X1 [Citrus sinensis]XP_052291685.1 probable ADP-ribosylation factor GTPase-activating protein AGD14 isoform X1 [Citrus sinensis]KAH9762102.1 Arf-GAP domain-containing protein [Citrus sinensis]GAY66658.1 hypothetical protein CUMW_250540 [Citrus unshiu]GAY66659.1 hypothetical protein CUMW_250540 [Citrus unshiu]